MAPSCSSAFTFFASRECRALSVTVTDRPVRAAASTMAWHTPFEGNGVRACRHLSGNGSNRPTAPDMVSAHLCNATVGATRPDRFVVIETRSSIPW